MFKKFIFSQLLKRVTGGKIERPNKVQALVRLPSLLRLTIALLRDERIPLWQRGGVLALIGLILSPIDAIGDIPVIGQVWDFTLAVVVLDAFINMAPSDVVHEHVLRLGLEQQFPGR